MNNEDDQSNVVSFSAHVELRLNKKTARMNGEGTVDLHKGTVSGKYLHDLNDPNVHPMVFQTVLITGYPSVCRAENNFTNPFQLGDYHYKRDVDFGPHGFLSYAARCWVTPNGRDSHLNSEFKVQGELTLPELQSAVPLVEAWQPSAEGIGSRFEITWPVAGGGGVTGRATTSYFPRRGVTKLAGEVRRHIRFLKAHYTERSLEVIQESWIKEGS
jgi:hypothetical protein